MGTLKFRKNIIGTDDLDEYIRAVSGGADKARAFVVIPWDGSVLLYTSKDPTNATILTTTSEFVDPDTADRSRAIIYNAILKAGCRFVSVLFEREKGRYSLMRLGDPEEIEEDIYFTHIDDLDGFLEKYIRVYAKMNHIRECSFVGIRLDGTCICKVLCLQKRDDGKKFMKTCHKRYRLFTDENESNRQFIIRDIRKMFKNLRIRNYAIIKEIKEGTYRVIDSGELLR